MDMDKIEAHIDKVRAATGVLSTVSDQQKESIQTLKNNVDKMPTDLEVATELCTNKSQQYTKMYCDEKFTTLETTVKEYTSELEKAKTLIDSLENTGAAKSNDDKAALEKLQAEINELKNKGGCCEIM